MRGRWPLLARIVIVALVLAVVATLAHGELSGFAGKTAGVVRDATERAVALARGAPVAGPTTEALNPKVGRQTAAYTTTFDTPLAPGEGSAIPITIRNQGDDTWEATGPHAVKLAYHLYDSTGALLTWDGPRSALPADVPPGGAITVAMRLAAPAFTGIYTIKPDLIREGQAWF